MNRLDQAIQHKAYNVCPSYGTYQGTEYGSKIERMNIFPYPFYFVSNPFSDEPSVNPRRAGWSPQYIKPEPQLKPDPYPNHCFQAACNTRFTDEVVPMAPTGAGATKSSAPAPPSGSKPVVPSPSDKCATSRCINLYR